MALPDVVERRRRGRAAAFLEDRRVVLDPRQLFRGSWLEGGLAVVGRVGLAELEVSVDGHLLAEMHGQPDRLAEKAHRPRLVVHAAQTVLDEAFRPTLLLRALVTAATLAAAEAATGRVPSSEGLLQARSRLHRYGAGARRPIVQALRGAIGTAAHPGSGCKSDEDHEVRVYPWRHGSLASRNLLASRGGTVLG